MICKKTSLLRSLFSYSRSCGHFTAFPDQQSVSAASVLPRPDDDTFGNGISSYFRAVECAGAQIRAKLCEAVRSGGRAVSPDKLRFDVTPPAALVAERELRGRRDAGGRGLRPPAIERSRSRSRPGLVLGVTQYSAVAIDDQDADRERYP